MYRTILNVARRIVCDNVRPIHVARAAQSMHLITHQTLDNSKYVSPPHVQLAKRFKHSKKKRAKQAEDELEDEDEDEEDENIDDPDIDASKVVTFKASSLRMDTVLKSGLQITRSKIEEEFYAGHIYINGKKALKKSVEVDAGDEIDMIVKKNIDNPNFVRVNRLKLLSTQVTSNGYKISATREMLLIDAYDKDDDNVNPSST